MSVIKTLFFFGPLFFGLAFLAPLIAQTMQRLAIVAPLTLSPIQLGLIIGGVLGAVATYRGKWI